MLSQAAVLLATEIFSPILQGFTADQIGSVPSAGNSLYLLRLSWGHWKFSASLGDIFSNLNSGNPSAGEVLSEATKSANTTVNLNSVGSSVYNLYGGITALTDGNSKNNAQGAVQTAAGAYGAYKAYDTYQAAQAAQAATQSAEAAGATTSQPVRLETVFPLALVLVLVLILVM